jgi:predicted AAA+ superfamily ATPase
VIDEIQKAPDLLPAIKLTVDRDRRPGRFLLTGSANVLTLPRVSESLAGRMEVLPLYPFSAGELAGRRETFVARLFEGSFGGKPPKAPPAPLAARLACGGFPEAVQRRDPARRAAWFAAYISTLLQRDVRDLARVDALYALPNLLRVFAARTAGLLNLADVGRDAVLPHTSVTRYLALLEMLFLVQRVPAWSANFGQRLVKAAKLHVGDTGLACHLIGVDAARLNQEPALLGRLAESFVAGELRKQIAWTDPQTGLFHFRTAAGLEVDFVLEKPDGSVAGVEVKSKISVGPGDFLGLSGLRERLGKRWRAGVLLYTGDRVLPFGDGLWALPIETLWCP